MENKHILQKYMNNYHIYVIDARHRETWYAVSTIKGDKRYQEYIESVDEQTLTGGIDMCETLDYIEKRGIEKGIETGIEKGIGHGEDRISELNIRLIETGRMDDVLKAAKDKDYRKKLLEEFGL